MLSRRWFAAGAAAAAGGPALLAGAARADTPPESTIDRITREQVLRIAGRMNEIATLRNPMLQGIRNTVTRFASSLPFVQHKMANQLSEMDIGYPESPLTVRDVVVWKPPCSRS